MVLDKVIDIDPDRRKVIMQEGELTYDKLVIATGVSHHYFGNDLWATDAPGLKTVEDALEIRRRIFLAFEEAEKIANPQAKQEWLTFVIVGGGPTGVELAGAIAEIAHKIINHDFQQIDTTKTRIILVEGIDRVLSSYPQELSQKARASLEHLGVTTDLHGIKSP